MFTCTASFDLDSILRGRQSKLYCFPEVETEVWKDEVIRRLLLSGKDNSRRQTLWYSLHCLPTWCLLIPSLVSIGNVVLSICVASQQDPWCCTVWGNVKTLLVPHFSYWQPHSSLGSISPAVFASAIRSTNPPTYIVQQRHWVQAGGQGPHSELWACYRLAIVVRTDQSFQVCKVSPIKKCDHHPNPSMGL